MRLKYFLLYAVYGLAAALFFLITLFPEERAAYILCKRLNAGFTDREVVMDKVTPIFPLAIKAVNPAILFDDGDEIKMAFISLYPSIFSLYKDVKKIQVKAEGYSGTIDGTVELGSSSSLKSTSPGSEKSLSSANQNSPSENNLDQPYDMALKMRFVDLKIVNLKNSVENIEILSSFNMSGDFNYSGYVENIMNSGSQLQNLSSIRAISTGSGSGNITLSQCTVKSDNIFLKQMGAGEVQFTKIDIKWDKDEKRVNIATLNAEGAGMKIHLKGGVNLKRPLESSTLNFRGDLQPESAISPLAGLASLSKLFSDSGDKMVSFRITGTLGAPKVTTP